MPDERRFVVVSGLPASGKSTLATSRHVAHGDDQKSLAEVRSAFEVLAELGPLRLWQGTVEVDAEQAFDVGAITAQILAMWQRLNRREPGRWPGSPR